MDQASQLTAFERVLRRDRLITFVALFGATLLAWIYIATIGTSSVSTSDMAMPGMSMSDMAMPARWTWSYFAVMAAMWVIMMIAMMLPSAAAMILLFAAIERKQRAASPFVATAKFAFAYLLLWAAIGLAAATLQWQLDRLALLTPAMTMASATFAAITLIAAGLYQFTPLKRACLRGCRSPLEFISQYWGRGPFGLGLTHGLYCIGCCWMLMVLLFVVGVMNLRWVAIIAAFVLVEKIAPRGNVVGYFAGAALIVAGLWQLGTRVLL